jgi:hypothetical protein
MANQTVPQVKRTLASLSTRNPQFSNMVPINDLVLALNLGGEGLFPGKTKAPS